MTCYVTRLESALDGTSLPADRPQTLHKDRPLWVRYDLDAVGRAVTKDDWAAREPSLWRYRELLPYADPAEVVTLGETMTPLVPCRRSGRLSACPTCGSRTSRVCRPAASKAAGWRWP